MDDKVRLHWMSFVFNDWLSGTAELTKQQKGIYIDLMSHAGVRNGDGLPNNFDELCRIINIWDASAEKMEELKTDLLAVVSSKFKLIDNRYHNVRQLNDFNEKVEVTLHRVNAGKKGGLAKAKQTSIKASESESLSKYESLFNNTIWEKINVRRGSKKKAYEKWLLVKDIIDPETIVNKYNNLCNDTQDITFVPHLTTWLAQERYNDEDVFSPEAFKKRHGISANYLETKDGLHYFSIKEAWGWMDFIYDNEGNRVKEKDGKEEKKTA
tara:strand:+ start:3264 stop:4067 length:804 start_codon:yes stop_codon:yes gene_type:complete